MKNVWKAKALVVGKHTLEKSVLTHNVDLGMEITFPVLSFAIENDSHKIIVDTGQHDAEWLTKNRVRATTAPDEFIDVAMKNAMGWGPEDVDMVVHTHLHFDHCGNNNLFKNAKFVINRLEWEYAYNPMPHQQRLYMTELFGKKVVNYFDWMFVEGDWELFPGLAVIHTPGHTPGHQSVLVRTEDGVVCFSGDVCNLVQNINENIISNMVVNPKDMFESYQKIRNCADFIVPGHEPLIKQGQSCDFPVIL